MPYQLCVMECFDRRRMPREFRVEVIDVSSGVVVLDDSVVVIPGRSAQEQLEQLVNQLLTMTGELYGEHLQRLVLSASHHPELTLCGSCLDRWDRLDTLLDDPNGSLSQLLSELQPAAHQRGYQH